jgi:hypothetical protein
MICAVNFRPSSHVHAESRRDRTGTSSPVSHEFGSVNVHYRLDSNCARRQVSLARKLEAPPNAETRGQLVPVNGRRPATRSNSSGGVIRSRRPARIHPFMSDGDRFRVRN